MRSRAPGRSRHSRRERPVARSAAIEARGWGARYRGRAEWAIRGLDLRVEAGERVLLVGPSGGGKSTLLFGIAGLHGRSVPADLEGELLLGGRPARHGAEAGIVFQDPESQIVMARCGDEVAFGLEERCVPSDEIWPRVDEALAAVGFPYGRDHPTAALSGGEKQRLALASVLALRPRVLLLDEPSSSLDPDGARALYAVLRYLPRETTVVLVEHHVDLAREIVDRVVAVDGARGVVADGSAPAVLGGSRELLDRLGVWVAEPEVPAGPVPTPAPAIVAARQVSFRYPGGGRDALLPTDIELHEGGAVALTGPNGAGKSTLLLLLGGLVRPQQGSVRSALDPARPEPWRWSAADVARRLGSVFQDPDHQFLATTVRDELTLGPRLAGAADGGRRRAQDLLERLRLQHLAEANPFTLSGGEKRRLSVGTAIATAPRGLLLDEPTYGQDRSTFGELLGLLREARDSGAALCVATHERELIVRLTARVVALERAA